MKPNISNLSKLFRVIDSYISASLKIENVTYEIEHFHIGFSQSIDHKGQPQQETKGGQLFISLTQVVDFNIIDWAKRTGLRKNGEILFTTESSGTVFKIQFENASCISFKQRVGSMEGVQTELAIAPEKVKLNEFTHDNRWRS